MKPQNENPSAPAGSKNGNHTAAVLDEADRIEKGEDPAQATGPLPGASTEEGAPDGTRAPADAPPHPAASESDKRLAALIVKYSNKALVNYFGPGAEFGMLESDIAVADWAEVIACYMPKLLTGSPAARLTALYGMHIAVLLGVEWMQSKPEPSPATSAAVDPEKQL